MMMLKMMNPMGSMPSVPKVGGDDEKDAGSVEDKKEQERLRQEAIKQAEKERKNKYMKEREVRDQERDKIRERYKIEKKPTPEEEEEEEESDEEDDAFGPKKKAEDLDTVGQAKKAAEENLGKATSFFKSFF